MQAENNREQDGKNPEDISEGQNYVAQLGDSPPQQDLHETQSMNDVEEPATYDGAGEWGSLAPSTISSSFYSDEVLLEERPLEERPLEEGPSKVETPLQAIASAQATKEDELPLFDIALWSLHPSECFEAAMAYGSHVILVFPAGRIHIDQHIAASAFQLGDNAKPLEGDTRKRVVNDNISEEGHVRKKQIV